MAFPITRSAFAGVQGTNSTSWTLTYPGAGDILDGGGSAIVAGDLIVVNIGADGAASAVSAITGYTSLFRASNGSVCHGETFVKIADGTETGTFTYGPSGTATEQGVWRVMVVKDWWGTIATGVEVSASATGATTTPNPAALNPTNWDVEDTFWRAVFAADDGRTGITSYPANYGINQNHDASGGSGGANMGSAGRNNAVASEDPGTFTKSGTGSAAAWVAWVIGIRPAAPPPPGGDAMPYIGGGYYP